MTEDNNEWTIIREYPNYLINKKGEIYSKYRKKLLKPQNAGAYLKIRLRNDKKIKYCYLHRLLAETFIPNPKNKQFINHINGNKLDNSLQNLEWVTSSENQTHSVRILGHKPINPTLGKFGKKHHRHIKVQQIKNNKVINEYYGIAEASRKTGINENAIRNNAKGRSSNAGGYQWKQIISTNYSM